MPIEIGQVEAIFRYPVKSMGGERLEVANLGWHGLDGDRRMAFRRIDDRSGFPWLTATKLPELLLFAPRRGEGGAQGELPTHVRTPDGKELPVFGGGVGHGGRTSVRGSRADDAVEAWHLRRCMHLRDRLRYGARDRKARRGEHGRATISPEYCGSFIATGSLPGGRLVGQCALIR